MPYFATINLRTVLRLESILASRAYGSISIVCGGGGIPPRLAHAQTAETRSFLLLFGPGNEASCHNTNTWYFCSLLRPLQIGQDLKNIKNVNRCRDGMPKSMQTRWG